MRTRSRICVVILFYAHIFDVALYWRSISASAAAAAAAVGATRFTFNFNRCSRYAHRGHSGLLLSRSVLRADERHAVRTLEALLSSIPHSPSNAGR